MIPYKIILSESASIQLEKLDKGTAARIVRKLKSVSDDPQRAFVKLSGSNDFKLRVGDYRIIAIMLKEEKMVLVIAIGHRKNVYQKL